MSHAGSAEFVDYYQLLGIQPSASTDEIRRAFILKAKEHHPDAGGSTAVMLQMNKAYKTLTDSTSKAAYDMLHSFHSGSTNLNEYRYNDGRKVRDVTDMTDAEIDAFLDDVFTEYRDAPKQKPSLKQWLKNFV